VDVADEFTVLHLPAFQAALLGVRLGVLGDEGEELAQQAVAGALEGVGGTLEALEELGADQGDDLLLAALDELDPLQV
jgi:hypothetical protein